MTIGSGLVPQDLSELAAVSIKALLLYLTAVFAFRVSKPRTLAEMSPFDFVAAVAAGAVVGRVPNATGTTFLAGAVTLVTILVLHRIITQLRYFAPVSKLVDQRPRLLFANGEILEKELKACGLTRNDLFGLLRQRGVLDLDELKYVILEQRGQISIVMRSREPMGKEGLLGDVLSQCPPSESMIS